MDETTVYYERRAAEYDRIYDLPQWQQDLARLRDLVATFAAARHTSSSTYDAPRTPRGGR